MLIFPAIDLIGGEAVRLTKGDYSTKEVYSKNPTAVLEGFLSQGATHLHVVDLDGAKSGEPKNFEVIQALSAYDGVFVEVGGGIRDEQTVQKYLDAGVNRVILGTAALKDFEFVRRMAAKYPSAIAVGVDAKDGKVAVNGWEEVSAVDSFEFVGRLARSGVRTVIYTDISTDGAMCGPNLTAMAKLSRIEGLSVVASGGVSSIEDVTALKSIGVDAVIIGKALYLGKIDLKQAVAIAEGAKC